MQKVLSVNISAGTNLNMLGFGSVFSKVRQFDILGRKLEVRNSAMLKFGPRFEGK